MKIFANKNIWKKIVIAFMLVISVSFVAPKPVHAERGGELMKPVCSFLVSLGDGIINVLHESLVKSGRTLISIDLEQGILDTILIIAGSVLVCIIVAGILYSSGGTLLAPFTALAEKFALTAIVKGTATALSLASVAGGVWASVWLYDNGYWGNKEVHLPIYSITPEEIFRNDEKFPLFSVNFFNANKNSYVTYRYNVAYRKEVKDGDYITKDTNVEEWATSLTYINGVNAPRNIPGFSDLLDSFVKDPDGNYCDDSNNNKQYDEGEEIVITKDGMFIDNTAGFSALLKNDDTSWIVDKVYESKLVTQGSTFDEESTTKTSSSAEYYYISEDDDSRIYKLEVYIGRNSNPVNVWEYTVSSADIPQKYRSSSPIKEGEQTTGTLDYDSSSKKWYSEGEEVVEGKIYPFAYQLKGFISSAYRSIRMIAAVGMMSVLVYIGIRILLSSTSPQKAKYKQLLGDWFIGMILLFTMHYIMYFSNIFVDEISRLLNSINPNMHAEILEDSNGKIEDALNTAGYRVLTGEENMKQNDIETRVVYKYKKDGKTYIQWFTNLMGAIRVRLNYNAYGDNEAYIGYTIMFIVMVIYTITFSWTYIKRIIYMAFLTMIAPLVALTYPIDKANDGRAQGFNYWFKEYIFNLLIQPLHLLIYTLLVSAAIEFSSVNIVYSLVALGFISGAEKIMRAMFNFSKASTPGVLAGPAGAALTMTGMRWLFGHGPRGGGDPKGGPSKDEGAKIPVDKRIGMDDLATRVMGERTSSGGEDSSSRTYKSGRGDRHQEDRDYLDETEGPLDSNTDPYINRESAVGKRGITTAGGEGGSISSRTTGEEPYQIDVERDVGEDIEFETAKDRIRYGDDQRDKYIKADNGELLRVFHDANGRELIEDKISGKSVTPQKFHELENERREKAKVERATRIAEKTKAEERKKAEADRIKEKNEESKRKKVEEARRIGEKGKGGYTDLEAREFIAEQSTSNRFAGTVLGRRYRTLQGRLDRGEPLTRDEYEGVKSAMSRRRAISDTADAMMTAQYNKLKKKAEKSGGLRDVAKVAGGVAGAAAFGMAGIAAGVASGDAKNVGQYGIAGVAGGYKLGSNAVNASASMVGAEGKVEQAYQRAKYGEEEYNRRQAEKYEKELIEREETIRAIQKATGGTRQEARELAQERIPLWRRAGYENPDDWTKLLKMEKKEIVYRDKDENVHQEKISNEAAILGHKLYDRYGHLYRDGKMTELNSRLQQQFGNDPTTIRMATALIEQYDNIVNG